MYERDESGILRCLNCEGRATFVGTLPSGEALYDCRCFHRDDDE